MINRIGAVANHYTKVLFTSDFIDVFFIATINYEPNIF